MVFFSHEHYGRPCSFGVAELFDYRNTEASAIDRISGGLNGIRIAEGLPAVSAQEYRIFIDAIGAVEAREPQKKHSAAKESKGSLHRNTARRCKKLSRAVKQLRLTEPPPMQAALPRVCVTVPTPPGSVRR